MYQNYIERDYNTEAQQLLVRPVLKLEEDDLPLPHTQAWFYGSQIARRQRIHPFHPPSRCAQSKSSSERFGLPYSMVTCILGSLWPYQPRNTRQGGACCILFRSHVLDLCV